MNDQAIEQEIQAKGLTAPRITPADIAANIASEHYFTASDGVVGVLAIGDATGKKPGDQVSVAIALDVPDELELLTFCVLVLKNGFTVTGESACASPKNFDAELGRKIARENAVNKMWPLMGYALKQQMHGEQLPAASAALWDSAAPLSEAQLRAANPRYMALGMALRTPDLSGHEDVLQAARAYEQYLEG